MTRALVRARHVTHRRAFAALIAVAWLVSPAIALLHGAHAHRYCAEHQRIEEGSAPGGAETSSDARVTGDAAPRPEHDACPFVVAHQRRVTPPSPSTLALVPALAVKATRREVLPGYRPVPVLATAPKSSPPRG